MTSQQPETERPVGSHNPLGQGQSLKSTSRVARGNLYWRWPAANGVTIRTSPQIRDLPRRDSVYAATVQTLGAADRPLRLDQIAGSPLMRELDASLEEASHALIRRIEMLGAVVTPGGQFEATEFCRQMFERGQRVHRLRELAEAGLIPQSDVDKAIRGLTEDVAA